MLGCGHFEFWIVRVVDTYVVFWRFGVLGILSVV